MFNTFQLTKEINIHIVKVSTPVTPNPHNWMTYFHLNFGEDFKCFMVSDFSLRKLTNEYLEKSSTTTRTYLLPSLLLVHMVPLRSIWRRFKGLVVLISLTYLCELFVYLPYMHPPQMGLDLSLSLGIPLTFSLFTKCTRSL